MIIFKINSILMVSVFILSFRELNAPDTIENVENQLKCLDEINAIFPANDIRENAKIAFNYLTRVNRNGNLVCYDSRDGTYHNGHAYVYYSLFENFLRNDSIPTIDDACTYYNGLNKNICFEIMLRAFGALSHKVIIEAFYNIDRGSINTIFNRIRSRLIQPGEALVIYQENKSLVLIFPNVIMEYWIEMIKTFRVDIGDGLTGMPTKADYCEQEYLMSLN